ncbi:Spc7-domain-containing protein [Annulohypoxylon maeteangense]|uniref:Spc7-domain-containing protein n=1 Tax=Annulohypoxylon maeteangense TaxID=1927788 RepID=UPI002008DF2F|nr:Spc7-domain-containing protein [Annulohypoxylon maeteangense]KAI0882106.1 Spc7-domain-containing protein [Annulohypoxylon maeteangense]
MSSRNDATLPSTRRPRKSTGHSPVRKRMEKENITVDVASSLAGNGGKKKLRSKSIGPGGLDGLKPGTGNRRVSLAANAKPPPKSILKPTMPLPEIPSFKSKQPARNSPPSLNIQGADKLMNPFQNDDTNSSGTKIAVRTEEEQQAAAREREERERAKLEKEINDRREARRKSLANRRVSFAAEATLHTFHEVEYNQDSTTSTDSTRRASSLATPAQPPDPAPAPAEQEDDIVPNSPDHQQDPHQKKRRRSSGAPQLNFNNQMDDTLASSVYSSDSDATDGVMEAQEDMGSDSGSDSDDADGVSMDLDVDEVTGTSVASAISARSAFTTDSTDTLETALRLASRRAETQQLDEEEEIIPSFGWAKKPAPRQASPTHDQENIQTSSRISPIQDDDDQEETGGMDMDMDMDMTNAVGGIIKSNGGSLDDEDDAQDDEMSMDVTRALGGILPQRSKTQNIQPGSPDKAGDDSIVEDASMEFTMAVGGIRKGPQSANNLLDLDDSEENEDMSMEFTTAVGGVLSGYKSNASTRKAPLGRRRTMTAANDEATMDMTVGLGRILPTNEVEDEEDATMGMDMTMAVGGIIKGPPLAKDRTEARHIMEKEVDEDDNVPALHSSAKQRLSEAISGKNVSETGSPSLSAFRGKGLRRSINWRGSASPKSSSPVRDLSTPKFANPAKQSTPNKQGPRTPLKEPPSRNPKSPASTTRRNPDRSTSTPRSASKNAQSMSIFQKDPSTGLSTPRVILTPQSRRLSGLGADRPGLGSPKVAAIFDRRESIGDTADNFVPREGSRGVTFADPRIMEYEVDLERRHEVDKENGRYRLEREADGEDEENTTATLKDMISSMTPKKNHLKGRKSLHVGSAKGLLGKRPAELDNEEEEEERDGIKRLKNHQSSPVKNVRLHAPPSKAETTGRVTRSAGRTLEDGGNIMTASTPVLSPKKAHMTMPSPQVRGRFKDVDSNYPTDTLNFDASHVVADSEVQMDDDGERMHLQDFLNMTNIRFMELTTTKRRRTQAPTSVKDDAAVGQEDLSLQRCVVAGACTVPMLELYQHSCRELKKYISEGRRIVREIETETLEENPPLFKEYMSATPEYKLFLDNQFKNVKTHARLLSKAMWYEWRMKLQDGLKEGLVTIAEGMKADEQLLQKEQKLLDSVLPKLIERFESLDVEHNNLESAVQEIADCDPEDLQAARSELTEVDANIEAKMKQIEQLRQQLGETESGISELSERKEECLSDIKEAEKVREECRGWTSNEVSSLKARVENIEKQHGWMITGTNGTMMSMTYRKEIELVFDVAVFKGVKPTNSTIDLWYIAANRERDPKPSTPEKEFFIQCIRDRIRELDQSQTRIKELLDMVSAGWKKAKHVSDSMRLVDCTFKTKVTKTSDSSIAFNAMLLVRPVKTRVDVTLNFHGRNTPSGIDVTIEPEARVVYGEQFKIDNVVEFLKTRIGARVITKEEQSNIESWSDIIVELQERLVAKAKAQQK